ncbi:hypothetical protein WN51_03191 [Melipona quadrifasciata]|uniref:Uncharacterized protein n=1 Tax=Melipona quadrifasciata TaxID=166423 RepID=A0A0N0BEP5_9HYME|nr:hypothetical protein WN51_03191 [Melipona quadrifasciata]
MNILCSLKETCIMLIETFRWWWDLRKPGGSRLLKRKRGRERSENARLKAKGTGEKGDLKNTETRRDENRGGSVASSEADKKNVSLEKKRILSAATSHDKCLLHIVKTSQDKKKMDFESKGFEIFKMSSGFKFGMLDGRTNGLWVFEWEKTVVVMRFVSESLPRLISRADGSDSLTPDDSSLANLCRKNQILSQDLTKV